MNWESLFRPYGSPSDEGRVNITGYLLRPDKLEEEDRIAYYDQSAARLIEACEATAAALREYRQALARRYTTLAAMPYTYRLELKREKAWHGSVTYCLRLLRVYADGHTTEERSQTYPGPKRHQALKDYQAALKARPGIDALLDIQKGKWER